MDRWTDRLSAYLDDELGREERAEIEAHLAECSDCQLVLADLRAVVGRARTLDAHAPHTDLWPGILARIEGGADVVPIGVTHEAGRTARFAFTSRQLIAACLALLMTGAATSWFALSRVDESPAPVASLDPAAPGTGALVSDAPPAVERRLVHLEAMLDAARMQLDPETIAVIEKNLALVQAAVEEAERALANDPANDYLRAHLERTLRTKVDVLERATALAET